MQTLLKIWPAAYSGLRGWVRGTAFKLTLAATALGGASLAHADLWAYVDEFGITHFASAALDERYQPYFKGWVYDSSGQTMKPGFDLGAVDPQESTRTPSFFDGLPRYKSVRPHLQKAAEKTGVDYDLIKAVIAVESGFNTGAVSPKGAVGLMQLMPATAERFGVSSSAKLSVQQKLVDPAVNVPAGARYLSYLMSLFPGRLDLVLAAYNAGEGAVKKAGQAIPPYPETRNYVKAVTGIYEQLQSGQSRSTLRAKSDAEFEGFVYGRVSMTLPGKVD
ncbi:lytic transglycosylase domain-containing protein [Comamonas sp. lk]|uniref:lytic transglycosylase domain-containing protein n=1 Tax=Comamonas sp. lk TaxID=2201272 RepID=UPI000EAD1C7E|nr:lytic transglycosylase domain-containing protein [Comamonas sp. lk]